MSRSSGAYLLIAALVVVLDASCGAQAGVPTGGETHFLMRCADDGVCGEGLECRCGVCTRRCTETAECRSFPHAECVQPATNECSETGTTGICDVGCMVDGECFALSGDHRCEAGVCRLSPGTDGTGGSGGGSSPPAGGAAGEVAEAGADGMGAAGSATCGTNVLTGSEVLVLGDSFFAETHQITADLEALARTSQVLAPGERFRDVSSITANTLAFGERGIEGEYVTAFAEAPARVVIMNGGGADLLLGSCEALSPDCPLMTEAVSAASDLLARMGEDGVERVVYAFYPDYADAALKAEMDVLRPLLANACAASPACRWLDLRSRFAGRSADYLEGNGVLPTAAGAQVTAEAIWSLLAPGCTAP